MSILKRENVENEEEIYFNFINSLKSEVTKKTYERYINLFMEFSNVTRLSELLTMPEPQKQIIKYIMSLRQKGLAFNSISLSLCAIFHFYDMNDVILNKKKINMFKGEFQKRAKDRAYTHEEIKKILDVSDLRMKCIITLMASSGCRVGAIPLLRLRNIEKINSIYKITVYEGTNEDYYTFCSPECTSFLDAYLEYRTQNGEKLHKDSFLIRDQFDITDIEQIRNKSKGITLNTVKVLVNTVLIKSGVRLSTNHTATYNRKEVAKCHGFRKFFTSEMIKSKVTFENRLMMEGHSLGITDHYARLDVQDNYLEYEKAIDNLTIDPTNRLKRKVKILEIEKSRLDKLESSMKRLEEKYHA